MKITQEEIVQRQTVLRIEMEDDDLGTYLNQGYRKVVQQTMIPGFRKGKAPRAIVERFVGRESLLQESLDTLLPEVTERAIAEQSLDTVGLPKVELEEFDPLIIKATVALKPEVDLGAYSEIRVEESTVEVSEDAVEEGLNRLVSEAGSWVPVERPVAIGDMVTMTATGSVDGRSILDEQDSVHVLEEGGSAPIPGFSESLVGAETGIKKEFTLVLPDEYSEFDLAGKEASFSVTVSETKERQLPELDDEFAKSVGDGFDSVAALRKHVESNLQDQAEKERTEQYRQDVIRNLLEGATIELPPLLVEHELEHLVSRRAQFVDSLNIQMDDFLRLTGKTEEQTREELKDQATERITGSFALTKLAEVEGITVSEDDIDERVQTMAASSDDPARFLENPELKSEEVKDSIRQNILIEKAVDCMVSIARGETAEESTIEPEPDTDGGTEDIEEDGKTDDVQT